MISKIYEKGMVELAADAGRAIAYYKFDGINETVKEMAESGLILCEKLLEGSEFFDKPKVKFSFISHSAVFKNVVEISKKEKEYVVSTVKEIKNVFQGLSEGKDVNDLGNVQLKVLEIINPIVSSNIYVNPGKV